MQARKEEDRDEDELVEQVKPLLEQAEKVEILVSSTHRIRY